MVFVWNKMKVAPFYFVIYLSFVASEIETNTTTTTSKSTSIKLCGLKRIRRTSPGVAISALSGIKSTAGLGPGAIGFAGHAKLAGLDLRNKFLVFLFLFVQVGMR